MIQHAKLSASGSSKWLNCPGSIKAEDDLNLPKEQSSVFAQEGTLAHEVADLCLKNRRDAEWYIGKKVLDTVVEKEMTDYVQEYLDYVLSHENKTSVLYTEERVDFSNVVPEGFGTMDAAVLDLTDGTCHIFDLKYGKGIRVDAFENTQGQMYALGLLNELGFMDDIKQFRIHIGQPRLNHFTYWDITVEDLIKFGEFVAERATLALSDSGPRVPGDKQCQWCKAKASCGALFNFTQEIISNEFEDLDGSEEIEILTITDTQKKAIIDNKGLIESFMKAVFASVQTTLMDGCSFPGYKLVHGRANRKWSDNAEEKLVGKIGDDAYKKSLIGLGAAEKLAGKDFVKGICYKPEPPLTMAKASDKRSAVSLGKVDDEFEDIS